MFLIRLLERVDRLDAYGYDLTSNTDSMGETFRPVCLKAPKEQPPRKLSGKWTFESLKTLEREAIASTDGLIFSGAKDRGGKFRWLWFGHSIVPCSICLDERLTRNPFHKH